MFFTRDLCINRNNHQKDIHVWVYTSKFAKRFGMPQEWVDDELKGAEALFAARNINHIQPQLIFLKTYQSIF
jgi:hypothetical protein